MKDAYLCPLASVESAWVASLSDNPDHQRAVTIFFKNQTFCVGRSGLYAGTDRVSGRRQLYCDTACIQRVGEDIAALVGEALESPARLTGATEDDGPTDVQPLSFQGVDDVKLFLKELKRAAKQAKQGRQLTAAQQLLLNARRWTAPFSPAATAAEAAAAATPATAGCVILAAAGGEACHGSENGAVGAAAQAACCISSINSSSSNGQGCAGARAVVSLTAVAGGQSVAHGEPLHSHAVSEVPDWTDSDEGEGGKEGKSRCSHASRANGAAPAGEASHDAAASSRDDSDSEHGGAGHPKHHTASGGPSLAAVLAAAPGGGGSGVLVVCCCIDLEWWERDASRVTEIGWTLWDNLTQRLESRHHIVSENEALLNRIHVPDHKHDFLFGTSASGPLAEGAAALSDDLRTYGQRLWARWCAEQQQGRLQGGQAQQAEEGQSAVLEQEGRKPAANGRAAAAGSSGLPPAPPVQLVLVGHGMSQDLKALSTLLGVTLPEGAAIVDTADLAWAALGPGAGAGQERMAISLRLLLKVLGINATKLHNGGNDARYTMEAMLALTALEAGRAE